MVVAERTTLVVHDAITTVDGAIVIGAHLPRALIDARADVIAAQRTTVVQMQTEVATSIAWARRHFTVMIFNVAATDERTENQSRTTHLKPMSHASSGPGATTKRRPGRMPGRPL